MLLMYTTYAYEYVRYIGTQVSFCHTMAEREREGSDIYRDCEKEKKDYVR